MVRKPNKAVEGPDSGWSWVIAGSCCVINMMMYGMMRLAGVMFVATFQKYPVSRQKASLPYTLSSTMRNVSGPLVGLLGHKFGVRPVTAAGALVGTFGIAMCFLARDTVWITVFWGGVYGLGFGLGNVLLPVSINQYFEKYRASASGIALAGACIGSFFLPPLVDALLAQYGLDGTFLILSGLVLNCLPFAMLLRKPTFTISSEMVSRKNAKPPSCSQHPSENLSEHSQTKSQDKSCDEIYYFNPSFVPDEIANNGVNDLGVKADSGEHKITQENMLNSSNEGEDQMKCDTDLCSFKYLNILHQQEQNFAKENVNFQKDVEAASSSSDKQSEDSNKGTLSKLMALLMNPMFIFISISCALYGFTFVCMITVIVDFAVDVGIDDTQTKYVMMCFSVGDLIGRLGLGWITDRGYMTTAGFSAMCFILQGVAGAAVMWAFDLWSLVSIMFIYGIFEAGIIIIIPVLIAQYVDQSLQTIAIPTSNLLYGPACLAVPLCIGFFREQLGSYDGVFLTIGASSVALGIAWAAVALWRK